MVWFDSNRMVCLGIETPTGVHAPQDNPSHAGPCLAGSSHLAILGSCTVATRSYHNTAAETSPFKRRGILHLSMTQCVLPLYICAVLDHGKPVLPHNNSAVTALCVIVCPPHHDPE